MEEDEEKDLASFAFAAKAEAIEKWKRRRDVGS